MTIPSFNTQTQTDALNAWRASVFTSVIRVIAYAGTLAYFILVGFLSDDRTPFFFAAYTIAYLLILVAAFASRVPMIYRAYALVSLIYFLGVFSSYEKASIGDGRIWFITAAIFAAVFLDRRAGISFAIIGALTWGGIGVLFAQGLLPKPTADQFSAEIWGGTTVTLLMAGLSIVLSVGRLLFNLNQTINEGIILAQTAEEQSKELDKQYRVLEQRSNDLEISAKISRKVAALITANNILLQAPIMMKKEFDMISVAFFRLGEDSLLHLASCEGWNEQAYPKHDYAVSFEDDITGAAVIHGEAISNKENEKGLLASLPETRSFASIPMRGRSSKTTGVLLVQSSDFEGLGTQRLATLQMLADQIAILMENADLLEEKESALEAERRAYGDITESSWAEFMQNQSYGGFLRDEKGLHSISAKQDLPNESDEKSYRVPIELRGRVIGYIDAHKPEERAWTVSEKELLNTLAGRLENTLDSARLYEEIQERATRERLVSEASSRMRESLDVQDVLRAAAEELHKALGDVAETEIWISPDDIQEDKPAID